MAEDSQPWWLRGLSCQWEEGAYSDGTTKFYSLSLGILSVYVAPKTPGKKYEMDGEWVIKVVSPSGDSIRCEESQPFRSLEFAQASAVVLARSIFSELLEHTKKLV